MSGAGIQASVDLGDGRATFLDFFAARQGKAGDGILSVDAPALAEMDRPRGSPFFWI
jgi:hypothetical protein